MTIGTPANENLIDASPDGNGGFWLLITQDLESNSIVIHLNSLGEILSQFRVGQISATSLVYSISENALYLSSISTTIRIYKLSAAGAFINGGSFSNSLGNNVERLNLRLLPGGNLVIQASGPPNVHLLIIDPSFNILSSKSYTPTGGNAYPLDICGSSDGNIFSLCRTINGTQHTVNISKFNANLDLLWSKGLGSTSTNIQFSLGQISTTNSQSLVVAFSNGSNIRFVEISFDGAILTNDQINFSGEYANATSYVVEDIAFNSNNGNTYITGYVEGPSTTKGFCIKSNSSSRSGVISDGSFTDLSDFDLFSSITFQNSSTVLFGVTNCSGKGFNDIKITKTSVDLNSCCLTSSNLVSSALTSFTTSTLSLTNVTFTKSANTIGIAPAFTEISSSCFE
jgi:hypothetical protein